MKKLIESRQQLTEGYSHYWEHGGFEDAGWAKLAKEAKKIIAAAVEKGIELAGASGSGKPKIKGNEISLNGKGKEGYEAFVITKEPQDFEFTRTERKPYDAVVASILAVAKKINKGFKPTSDGGPSAIKRTL